MPTIPTIQELHHRILPLMSTDAMHSIVFYLSEARNGPALRYNQLGDNPNERALNLIEYCRDNCCMSQLIALLKDNSAALSEPDQAPNPAWDDWAKAYDAQHAKLDPPTPAAANSSAGTLDLPNQSSVPAQISAGNVTDNNGNTAVGSGINQSNYSGVQGGVVNNYYFGGMSGSVSSNAPPPPINEEQGDLTPLELQQAASVVSQLHVYGAAAGLYSHALALANRGRFAETVDYFQKAVSASQAAGDLNAQLNILGDLARAYALLGQYAQSFAAYQQAIAIAMQTGNARAAGTALFEMGNIYTTLGQTQQAWTTLGQAYNMFMSAGDWVSANVTSMRAMALGQNFPLW